MFRVTEAAKKKRIEIEAALDEWAENEVGAWATKIDDDNKVEYVVSLHSDIPIRITITFHRGDGLLSWFRPYSKLKIYAVTEHERGRDKYKCITDSLVKFVTDLLQKEPEEQIENLKVSFAYLIHSTWIADV